MIYLILHKWTWQEISFFYVPAWKLIYKIIHNKIPQTVQLLQTNWPPELKIGKILKCISWTDGQIQINFTQMFLIYKALYQYCPKDNALLIKLAARAIFIKIS